MSHTPTRWEVAITVAVEALGGLDTATWTSEFGELNARGSTLVAHVTYPRMTGNWRTAIEGALDQASSDLRVCGMVASGQAEVSCRPAGS